MSEMIERVAEAIMRAAEQNQDRHGMARAAIEAMREPTKEMVNAVYEQADPGFCDEPGDPTPPDDAWRLMIDTALGNK